MGVHLTPVITKRILHLEDLKGKSLAVDANNYLYQFLSLIRLPDGTPLKDSLGNVTSHLSGLMFRSTRLIRDYNIKLIFVFDGIPPKLKQLEILKRRRSREKATREYEEALKAQDYAMAFSKAVMTSRLTKPLIQDAKHLLELLGIPYVQAPSEAEAQAAYMAMKGDVWAASSKDYDALLFGASRLLRYLTIYGREFLPSKGTSRALKPELIELHEFLSYHGITREQLVDIAILIGTDFNKGVEGIGPKTALKLIGKNERLENLPSKIGSKIPENYEEIRAFFLNPETIGNYDLKYKELDEAGVYHFLCDQRGFARKNVETIVERMEKFYQDRKQAGLEKWL